MTGNVNINGNEVADKIAKAAAMEATLGTMSNTTAMSFMTTL